MRVDIHNLGVIEHAQIDLKPLTVCIGPNGTGKTWTAYMLAAIFSSSGWRRLLCRETIEHYPPLEAIVQAVWQEGNAKLDLIQFANEYAESYINTISNDVRNWIGEFLGTKRNSFEALEVEIKLGETKERFLEQIKAVAVDSRLSISPQQRQKESALLNAVKEPDDPFLFFYTLAEGNLSEELPRRVVKDFIVGDVLRTIHSAFYPEVYTFPTERTTYITFPLNVFVPGKEPFKSRHNFREESIEYLPSVPVSRFLRMISSAIQTNLVERETQAAKDPAIQAFMHLANLLEGDILYGKLDFSSPEEATPELLFSPARNTFLEMPVVSSMIKELTPLVLYLRYLAEPGELLIIDEPEMNLHPEAQVRLMEFLGMLINAGLHILITTHSPYMLDHLGNLIKAARHENRQDITDMFYLKQIDAFVQPEHVAVYHFEHGTARNILDKDGEIDWSTFDDVSSRTSGIYFEL